MPHATDTIRATFEQWYAENAFDYALNPVGSRECGLQWAAWQAATAAERERWTTLLTEKFHSGEGKGITHGMQAAEQERLICGDHFTHERTGVRFVCRAVTRHDYGGSMPMLCAEIELAQK